MAAQGTICKRETKEMSDWIQSPFHLFFILGSLVAVFLSHFVIKSVSAAIVDNRRLDLSDSMMKEVFSPSSSHLTISQLRHKYVQSYFWSIVYYLYFDTLFASGIAVPSVMPRVTIAKVAGMTVLVLIPFVSMQLSSEWIPIRRTTSLLAGVVLLSLSFGILYWRGFLGG
jgi:hypothetical protein